MIWHRALGCADIEVWDTDLWNSQFAGMFQHLSDRIAAAPPPYNPTGVYEVHATHTYATDGVYKRLNVKLSDSTSGTLITSVCGTAVVVDPPVAATGGFTVAATQLITSTPQTVATFTDPGGAESVGRYCANIRWGDNSTSWGTISYNATSGVFTVTGAQLRGTRELRDQYHRLP